MSIEVNNVYNVDCLIGMGDIPNESIDLILCDLPYGQTQAPYDVVISPEKLWEHYERIIKPNGAILLFGQGLFTARMMLSNEKMWRYNIVWNKVLKSGFLNARRMPLRRHEDIMVFYKKPPTYNPQMTDGAPNHTKGRAAGKVAESVLNNRVYGSYTVVNDKDFSGKKHPDSIWTFPKPHPSVALTATEKPIELCRYAIRTFSNPGDIILDNCCGGGSTIIAAILECRKYIGMDNGKCDNKKSPYFEMPWADVVKDRISKLEVMP